MNRELVRRVAMLKERLQPTPEIVWNLWQKVLSRDEYAFVFVLHARGADCAGDPADASTWHDDWAGWRLLCDDERELALLHMIEVKARLGGQELWHHLHDLTL